jgi:hypothetical protein
MISFLSGENNLLMKTLRSNKMTKLIIFEIPGSDNLQYLVNWAKLFRMDVEIRRGFPIKTTHDGYDLLVTSDLFFKNCILSDVMQEKEIGSPLTVNKIKDDWYPSFCFGTSISDENPFALFRSDMKNISELMITVIPPTFKSPEAIHDKVMWNFIIDEWYQKENKYHISRLYYPIWIENIHKKSVDQDRMDDFKWFQDQSCFCISHPKVVMDGIITYKKFKELIRKDRIDFNGCKNGLKRFVYEVDVSKFTLTGNPLSIPGVFECIPVGENQKVDMSKTVVTFIYNLGRGDRPLDVYMKSIQKIAKLRYPVVFFGEKDICDKFMKYRGELSVYTVVVPKKMEEWELFRKYPSEVEKMGIDRQKSSKYAKLTSSKFWALEEAIEKNAFPSDTYVWIDGGIYKYDLSPIFKDELDLFKNIDSPYNKIVVESLSQGNGTSHEEYVKGVENILCAIIIGGKGGWKEVLPLLKKMIRSKFEENTAHGEQKILSRFDALYPGYLLRRYAGYDPMTLVHFLGLE